MLAQLPAAAAAILLMWFTCAVESVVTLMSYAFWRMQHAQAGYPKGPLSWPLLGNLPQVALSGNLVQYLAGCRQEYGNIFTLEFGGCKRLVVNGYDTIFNLMVTNSAYTSEISPAAVSNEWQQILARGPGILFAPHPHWKTMRNFFLGLLRHGGSGKQKTCEAIQHEADYFCNTVIEPQVGIPIDVHRPLAKATHNIISMLIFNERLDYDSPKLEMLLNTTDAVMRSEFMLSATENLSFLRRVIFHCMGIENGTHAQLMCLIDDELQARKAHYLQGHQDEPSDIFEAIFKRQELLKAQGSDDQYFSDENAKSLAFQLYPAGSETSSSVISWALLYLAHHPQILARAQHEIIDIIGCSKRPSYEDMAKMPFTEAVLLETYRLANVAVLTLPHVLSKEIVVDNQVLPKGSPLMVNMSSIHHDADIFEDPFSFNPDRYLDGDVKLKRQRTLPFFLGKRSCVGESVARMEVFLFLVIILQRYSVSLPKGSEKSKMDMYVTAPFYTKPPPHSLVFSSLQH